MEMTTFLGHLIALSRGEGRKGEKTLLPARHSVEIILIQTGQRARCNGHAMKNEMIIYYVLRREHVIIIIYEFSLTISADLSVLLILTRFRE